MLHTYEIINRETGVVQATVVASNFVDAYALYVYEGGTFTQDEVVSHIAEFRTGGVPRVLTMLVVD